MQAQEARTATCPACQTGFEAPGGTLEVICPACMNAFTIRPRAATLGGLPDGMEFEVKGPNGETMGQMDRHRIRQEIYAGRLKGREELRGPKGWEPIAGRPEYAEVFQLVGVDLGALRIDQQQIRGWRKTESQSRQEQRARRASGGATADPVEAAALKPGKKPVPLKVYIAGAGVFLLLLLGGAVLFAVL